VAAPAQADITGTPRVVRAVPHVGRGRAVRVLHVISSLGRQARTGGTEYGLIKLVNALDPNLVNSAICSGCFVSSHIAGLLDEDVRLFALDRKEARNDFRLMPGIWKAIRAFAPDILHTHGWGTLIDGLIAARLGRVPAVIHGEHGTLQTRAYQLRIQRWAWGQVDQVLSVSSRLAERISQQVGFPLERIQTIRNGVDLERFGPRHRAEGRAQLHASANECLVGTVGRLVPVKDQATFLRALAALKAHGRQFRGVIVGDGPLRADLEQLVASLGLGSHVQLIGHRSDVERVLAALDVFVLSSVSEGLSNTIQEALASGVPVVATNVGGADEMVTEGVLGHLVPASDAAALAAGIQRLVDSPPLRATMGASARARAEREFGVDTMVRGYADLYLATGDRLIARARGRAV
jgi:sugar transferase (PEP-CTERM/EpsH1 system associated)